MKRLIPSRTTLISAGVFFFGVPLYVWAAQTGLVPCGTASFTGLYDSNYYLQATNCNLCYFAQLIQNIVNFLLMVTIPISVAMFAWAGFKYLTAGGDVKRISRAHNIFSSVFIGFCIALGAWLFVQVVLQAVTSSNYLPSSFFNLSSCSQQNDIRRRDEALSTVLSGNGLAPTVTGAPSSGGGVFCPSGYELYLGSCYNPTTNDIVSATIGSSAASTRGRVVITNPDGTQTEMIDGSPSWRRNNPGNMIAGAGQYQPIGMDGGFAVFASYEDGFNAMLANLKSPLYQNGNMTIAAALYRWAPPIPGSGNDPVKYAAFVQSTTGIPSSTVINNLTQEQLVAVATAMRTQEGWSVGRTISR